MRHLIKIFLLFGTLNGFGQTAINNVSLDTFGLLKWNITYMTPHLKIEIQRNRGDQWITIDITGDKISNNVLYIPGITDTRPPSEKKVIVDSCIVPLNKGINRYRIIMTEPSKIVSKEVSANILSNDKKYILYGKDNYITLDKLCMFWIYDSNGNEIRHDSGRLINTTSLNKGLYYIVVNKDIYEFTKK